MQVALLQVEPFNVGAQDVERFGHSAEAALSVTSAQFPRAVPILTSTPFFRAELPVPVFGMKKGPAAASCLTLTAGPATHRILFRFRAELSVPVLQITENIFNPIPFQSVLLNPLFCLQLPKAYIRVLSAFRLCS